MNEWKIYFWLIKSQINDMTTYNDFYIHKLNNSLPIKRVCITKNKQLKFDSFFQDKIEIIMPNIFSSDKISYLCIVNLLFIWKSLFNWPLLIKYSLFFDEIYVLLGMKKKLAFFPYCQTLTRCFFYLRDETAIQITGCQNISSSFLSEFSHYFVGLWV